MTGLSRLGALIALAMLLPLTIAGCGDSEGSAKPQKQRAKAVLVGVRKVEPILMRDVLVLPGGAEAVQDVRLGAERAGKVERIACREGQAVKKGQLLAEIDVSALKAALDRARASAKLAAEQAQRRRFLHKRGVLPQEELDRALTKQILAEGRLREARIHYEQGFVRSPIDGLVNKLYVDPGEFAGKGAPVADLVNIDRIRINVNAPELDVRFLKVGQKARVTVDAFPGRQWLGRVDFLAFKADPATRTFKVRVVVDNPDRRIRPGMIARATFLRRVIPNALAAPLFAILDKGGERIIFVEKNGVARARTISIGIIDNDQVQITKGLEPGDRLIVVGQTEVEDGMKVKVQ